MTSSKQQTKRPRWFSQLGFNADYGKGDCGMAILASILDYHGIPVTVDELGRKANYPMAFKISNSTEMIKVAKGYGVHTEFFGKKDLDFVRNEVRSGRPVALIVWYPYLPLKYDNTYRDNHWILVIDETENGDFIYHDPYWRVSNPKGRLATISPADLSKAWRNTISSYGNYNMGLKTQNGILGNWEIVETVELTPIVVKIDYYELQKLVRWTTEQAIREIEAGNADLARQRLLSLTEINDGPLYQMEFGLQDLMGKVKLEK